jgi:hypothetical protein
MSNRVERGAWAVVALLAWWVAGSGTACAAPITEIRGDYPDVIRDDYPFDETSFTYIMGSATFISSPVTGLASDLTVDVSNFSTSNPQIEFPAPMTLVINVFGDSVTFNIASPGMVTSNNNTATPPIAEFETTVTMGTNTIPSSTLDLSGFLTGLLHVTVRGPEITPEGASDPTMDPPPPPDLGQGGGRVDLPDGVNYSATFIITSFQPEIPEPASLLLWGMVGLVGLGGAARRWVRRRGRQAARGF